MPNKFKAVKATLDGISFDSKREAHQYAELRLREKAGEISHLETQPSFQIVVNGKKIGKYTADFRFMDKIQGRFRVIDIKSPVTAKKADFRLRKKLVEALYPVIQVEVIT